MKKLFPWIAGFLIGVLLSVVIMGLAMIVASFRATKDAAYDLVAVSWGAPMKQENPWIYQVQVIGDGHLPYGPTKVSARICIGDGNRFYRIGDLGTARDMGDAMRKFGHIEWLPDRITIGGEDGVKATLMRSDLDSGS